MGGNGHSEDFLFRQGVLLAAPGEYRIERAQVVNLLAVDCSSLAWRWSLSGSRERLLWDFEKAQPALSLYVLRKAMLQDS